MPSASVYAVATHCTWSVDAPNSFWSRGMATLTMLVSSTAMKLPIMTISSGPIQPRPSSVSVAGAGGAGAGAGGGAGAGAAGRVRCGGRAPTGRGRTAADLTRAAPLVPVPPGSLYPPGNWLYDT